MALEAWNEDRLRCDLDNLLAAAMAARRCQDCEDQRVFQRFSLRSAILLHADREIKEQFAIPVSEQEAICGTGKQAQVLRNEPLATHYFGHAGPELWADEALLTVSDVATLDMDAPTVLFVWSCEAGWYQNLFGPSINEALLLVPGKGAMAAFGPAGATHPEQQQELFSRVYAPWLFGGVPLGEAIRRAKIDALAAGGSPAVIEGWNLLGDPALPAPPQ